jgi:hypothetical protein
MEEAYPPSSRMLFTRRVCTWSSPLLRTRGVVKSLACFEAVASPVPLLMPPPALCTDNAAMVGAVAHFRRQRGEVAAVDMDVSPSLKLG